LLSLPFPDVTAVDLFALRKVSYACRKPKTRDLNPINNLPPAIGTFFMNFDKDATIKIASFSEGIGYDQAECQRQTD